MNCYRVAIVVTALLLMVLASSPVSAQEWARKMFQGEREHDFGIVAAGSEAVHRFEFQNIFEEDVRVVSVRSSCGCTIASIENGEIKTHEKGAVVARFNTQSFRNHKQATLTVRIDRPYPAEVQLIVKGNIRGNVAFEPGGVQVGDVVAGKKSDARIRVTHYGNARWQITDVKTTFDFRQIKVGLTELSRRNGQVVYEMLVQLQDNVDPGYVQGELYIETNEGTRMRYPLAFNGRVVPPLQISPAVLTLGPLEPGETVDHRVLLKSATPFRITNITTNDECLKVQANSEPGRLQIMTVTYTAGQQMGHHRCQATIVTDTGQEATILDTIAVIEEIDVSERVAADHSP